MKFNIFRRKKEKVVGTHTQGQGRKKEKVVGTHTEGQDQTYSNSCGNSSSNDYGSSFFSSGESYESSWDSTNESGSRTSTTTKEAVENEARNCVGASDLVKAFTQYASQEVQTTKKEFALDVNMTRDDFETARGRARERIREFQKGLDGKFQSMIKSLELDDDDDKACQGGEDGESKPVRNSYTKRKPDETINLSIVERMEKQLEVWTDLALDLEKQLAGDYIINDEAGRTPTNKKKKVIFGSEKNEMDRAQIEEREPVDTKDVLIRRQNMDMREAVDTDVGRSIHLPVPSMSVILEPMKPVFQSSHSLFSLSPQNSAHHNRDRTRSEGHSWASERTTIMSPRLTMAAMPSVVTSAHNVQKTCTVYPKKNISSPRILNQVARTDNIDEIVARVHQKRSSEINFQNTENLFETEWIAFGSDQQQINSPQAKIQNPFNEIQNKSDEKAAEKLRDAQEEIELLKWLLAQKENLKNSSGTTKPKNESVASPRPNNDTANKHSRRKSHSIIGPKVVTVVPRGPVDVPFDEGVPNNILPSNNKNDEFRMHSKQFSCLDFSEREMFQEDMKIPPKSVPELDWDNFVGMDGNDDGIDEVSLLSNTLSPRRYGKGKRRGTPKGRRDMKTYEL